jgi:hypothetical protein
MADISYASKTEFAQTQMLLLVLGGVALAVLIGALSSMRMGM